MKKAIAILYTCVFMGIKKTTGCNSNLIDKGKLECENNHKRYILHQETRKHLEYQISGNKLPSGELI